MSQQLPNCRVTGKVSHRSKAAARKVLAHSRVSETNARSIYQCPHCENWHLTKQRRKRKGGSR